MNCPLKLFLFFSSLQLPQVNVTCGSLDGGICEVPSGKSFLKNNNKKRNDTNETVDGIGWNQLMLPKKDAVVGLDRPFAAC